MDRYIRTERAGPQTHTAAAAEISFHQEFLGQLELLGNVLLELLPLTHGATSVVRSHQIGPVVATEIQGFAQEWLWCLFQPFPIGDSPKVWEGLAAGRVLNLLFGGQSCLLYIFQLPFLSSFWPSGLIYLCLSGFCLLVWFVGGLGFFHPSVVRIISFKCYFRKPTGKGGSVLCLTDSHIKPRAHVESQDDAGWYASSLLAKTAQSEMQISLLFLWGQLLQLRRLLIPEALVGPSSLLALEMIWWCFFFNCF